MMALVEEIKSWFERQAFGVCEWWGDILHIRSANIRLFFIYTSFLTVGSPVIIYLVMAFWMKLGNMLSERRRGSVWDL
jgi:phage shock protein C